MRKLVLALLLAMPLTALAKDCSTIDMWAYRAICESPDLSAKKEEFDSLFNDYVRYNNPPDPTGMKSKILVHLFMSCGEESCLPMYMDEANRHLRKLTYDDSQSEIYSQLRNIQSYKDRFSYVSVACVSNLEHGYRSPNECHEFMEIRNMLYEKMGATAKLIALHGYKDQTSSLRSMSTIYQETEKITGTINGLGYQP